MIKRRLKGLEAGLNPAARARTASPDFVKSGACAPTRHSTLLVVYGPNPRPDSTQNSNPITVIQA